MLKVLSDSLDELLKERSGLISSADRIRLFKSSGIKEFTRKDYMNYFKTISSATASRDLLFAVKEKLVRKYGAKNKASYKIN